MGGYYDADALVMPDLIHAPLLEDVHRIGTAVGSGHRAGRREG